LLAHGIEYRYGPGLLKDLAGKKTLAGALGGDDAGDVILDVEH
jgi:hypothetical protein